MGNPRVRTAAFGVIVVATVVLLSVPVVAAFSRLTSIPLGRGSATISWTGKNFAGSVTPI